MAHAGQTIVNPRTGQTMTFRRTAGDTGGELLEIECHHEAHGPAEPEHTHPYQETRFEVLAGSVRFRIDGNERSAGPGEVVTIPAGAAHFFWNDGQETARYIQEFRPALRIERFFEVLFQLAREGKLKKDGMPQTLALAVLVPVMGNAIRPTNVPWPVLRTLAWALGPIARVRGYRRIEEAPPARGSDPESNRAVACTRTPRD